jgi:hypothetical protein
MFNRLQGAGRPEDHFIIPPVFIGFADAFIYLRDNKRFDEEVHKILAKTVRRRANTANWPQIRQQKVLLDGPTLRWRPSKQQDICRLSDGDV